MEKYSNTTRKIFKVNMSSFASSNLPQPFPMQGSKRRQAPLITKFIPSDASELIESFCGSSAISLAARASNPYLPIYLNDINKDIINLWSSILNSPEELLIGYQSIWEKQFHEPYGTQDSRDYFKMIRSKFNESQDRPPSEFLFILNRIVKGALRYNSSGDVNQSADGRRFGAKPETTAKRIMDSSKLLQGSHLASLNWVDSFSKATVKSLIYLDPPYQGTTETSDKRYIQGLSYAEFRDGVEDIISGDLSAIISYDAVEGPVTYGYPLHEDLPLLAIDVLTGVSAQGTLLRRKQESHETLYLTPALVKRLGGEDEIYNILISNKQNNQQSLF